ncbi:MAG TPA: sulfotransferase family protein [Pirellulaceae bacterium]|nr:sulfotransferase family protein [Pirellulaceae bacterium]
MLFSTPSICTRTCLVGRSRRFVYAYVPKAACTSLKRWLAAVEGLLPITGKTSPAPGIHAFVKSRAALPAHEAPAILRDPAWFKFAFVRNPLSRLVSAYLDKMVPGKKTAARLVRNFHLQDPQTDWWRRLVAAVRADAKRGLTFRQLVQQLGRERMDKLDEHFRPQSLLLAGLPLDFVGHVERMEADFAVVQQRLDTNVPLSHAKKQAYAAQESGDYVADWPVEEFRAGASHPHWRRFYPPEVLAAVARIYADDFARFGYRAEIEVPFCGAA